MMTLFSGKRLTGYAVAVGATLVAGTAVVPPARAADDLPMVDDIRIPMPRVLEEEDGVPPARGYERPYYERPYSQQRPYRPGPYGQGSYAAIPSAGYGRPALDARPVIPPPQIVAILRSTGYSPLGQMTQRGWIYTVAALDPGGDDGRLIIDARTGRIMRFIPAMEVDARLSDRMAMVYGPPGPPPVTAIGYENRRGSLLDLRRLPRPPAAVPRTAKRSVPNGANKPAAASPAQQAAVPAQPSAAAPSAVSAAPAKPAPAQTTAENKPAATTVGAAKPSAPQSSTPAPAPLHLWPTQAMPDVQTLE
jgi:hypothetical protein